jgi:hypothetical protein
MVTAAKSTRHCADADADVPDVRRHDVATIS